MRNDKIAAIAAYLEQHFSAMEMSQVLMDLRIDPSWNSIPENMARHMDRIRPTLPGLSKNLGLPLLTAALEHATGIKTRSEFEKRVTGRIF
jgi:hypothetical protein